MTAVQFRNLRDRRDEARRKINSASRDPVKALEYRHRAYAAWQALAKEVKDHGRPVFLPHKLYGDMTWCVHVLSPDASEKYIGTFQTERECEEKANWLESSSRHGK